MELSSSMTDTQPLGSGLRPHLGDVAVGDDESVAVTVVEADGDVARKLEMLLLVYAHGDEIGAEKQDVRSHEHGIIHQPHIDIVRVFRALILELRHPGRLAHIGVAVEDPRKLRMRGDVGLEIEHGLFGVYAAGEKLREKAHAHLPELRGLPPHGESVQIRDEEEGVVIILHFAPVGHRADIVAERDRARGLNAGEHHFFAFVLHFIVHF